MHALQRQPKLQDRMRCWFAVLPLIFFARVGWVGSGGLASKIETLKKALKEAKAGGGSGSGSGGSSADVIDKVRLVECGVP